MRNFILLLLLPSTGFAQLNWTNVDLQFGPLPASVHVYKTTDMLDGKPNIAFYITAELGKKELQFNTDTSHKRRLTPKQFYEKNEHPLIVVNTTFFSFQTNQNLNAVIKDGKLVGYNIHSIPGRGKDTFTYRHPFGSAIGISKERKADVAWLYTDTTLKHPYAYQSTPKLSKDSSQKFSITKSRSYSKWKMQSAVGGGPVLVQNGNIKITNNEELKFAGNAINDKHPRTAMGYTADGKLIILVVQGRFPGVAEGADLNQLAKMLKDIGCVEALNLDGGGSSCMLVNGKETIKPSDPMGQRPVPAVFLVQSR